MTHQELLHALRLQIDAYKIFHAAVKRSCDPSFVKMFLIDPFSLAVGEEFGTPIVDWFPFDSPLKGTRVEDGTLIFEHDREFRGAVYLLPGVQARGAGEVPADWKTGAKVVALFEGDVAFKILGREEESL